MTNTISTATDTSFVLRSDERGIHTYPSTGPEADYIAGHPESTLTRRSSLNFSDYQSGRAGFGTMRVFGQETFHGAGCGYNMHPHHNFVICAFVMSGTLTHVNTKIGRTDEVEQDDFYVFSAGSGGKHAELSISGEDMNVIYLWFLPGQLLLPPSYERAHFDRVASVNRIERLVGSDGRLPIPQDARIARLVTDRPGTYTYEPRTTEHGVYTFVIGGSATVDGVELASGDSIGIWDRTSLSIATGVGSADVLVVETVMPKGS
jgi:quercetin 2,3-dioxygenase